MSKRKLTDDEVFTINPDRQTAKVKGSLLMVMTDLIRKASAEDLYALREKGNRPRTAPGPRIVKDAEAELKPCPFCGNKAHLMEGGDIGIEFSVRCGYCLCQSPLRVNKRAAVNRWNRRKEGAA